MAAYDAFKKSIHGLIFVGKEVKISGFSWVLKNCIAVLQAAKPRIHALFAIWQERKNVNIFLWNSKTACNLWLKIPASSAGMTQLWLKGLLSGTQLPRIRKLNIIFLQVQPTLVSCANHAEAKEL